jgi:hypothetical protein
MTDNINHKETGEMTMKKKTIMKLCAAFSSTIIILVMVMTSLTVIASDGPTTSDEPLPITNPSEAKPFSHPLDNTVNPESPYYNPSDRYGLPGTRFGPPGQRSTLSPLNSPTEVGHRWFGAGIFNWWTNFVAAKHTFYYTLYIPSGTSLYAPTLRGVHYCPLEILSRYWYDNGTLRHSISVYDHLGGLFVVNLDIVSDYLSNGKYFAEILDYEDCWYAMAYNYSTSTWETLWIQCFDYMSEPYGWDVWEERNFNEANWPNFSGYPIEASNIQISMGLNTPANGGNEQKDMGSAPYLTTWLGKYYSWRVSQ